MASLVASCGPGDAREEAVPDTHEIAEAPPDSAPLDVDTLASLLIPPQPDNIPGPPGVPAIATDTSSFATSLELAGLSAALDVPVEGILRSQLRDSYTEARAGHVHEALDIMAARGTPVLSATGGRLLKLFNSKPGGLMVYATDASERFILFYGHLDSYADGLTNGMQLERGQKIGYVGTTGNAPIGTPHLHFGILRGNPAVSWSAGVPVNPYTLLVPATPPR